MNAADQKHQPVLLEASLAGLNIQRDGLYIDCTFGRGGHSRAILEQLGPEGRLLAIDRDPQAVLEGQKLQEQDSRFCIERGSFAMLGNVVRRRSEMGKVNGILFDLGVSSPQLDDAARGFSFSKDGPLDMRMDPESGISAAQWLATAESQDIERVLREYGEERYYRRITRAIIEARGVEPLETTAQLVSLIEKASPTRERDKHPATRCFQAIRIAVNTELESLAEVLEQIVDVLATGGRIVVISFHSLEDRLVKRFIRKQVKGDDIPREVPVTHAELHPSLKAIGKITRPDPEEQQRNPRSRSAVMRIAERLAT